MKMIVDLDDIGVDGKGEALRGLVFNQKYNGYNIGQYRGCYSTFELNEGFKEINPEKYPKLINFFRPDYDDSIKVQAYENEEIVAMWYWDGDGCLILYIKGEEYFYYNGDCKKDYVWEEIKY
jgi:hypothetical protein